jgi:hypothetical protein
LVLPEALKGTPLLNASILYILLLIPHKITPVSWDIQTSGQLAPAIMSQTEDLEKTDPTRDHVEAVVKDLANDERVIGFSAHEQKSIIRRIDRRLVLTLGSLYCISLLDRTNLGAASVAGYAYLRSPLHICRP